MRHTVISIRRAIVSLTINFWIAVAVTTLWLSTLTTTSPRRNPASLPGPAPRRQFCRPFVVPSLAATVERAQVINYAAAAGAGLGIALVALAAVALLDAALG